MRITQQNRFLHSHHPYQLSCQKSAAQRSSLIKPLRRLGFMVGLSMGLSGCASMENGPRHAHVAERIIPFDKILTAPLCVTAETFRNSEPKFMDYVLFPFALGFSPLYGAGLDIYEMFPPGNTYLPPIHHVWDDAK